MSSIMAASPGGVGSSVLPPSSPVQPEPRGLDLSSPGHTTGLDRPVTVPDKAPVVLDTEVTPVAMTPEGTAAETRTKQSTDTKEELVITTDITAVEQVETTVSSLTDAGQTTGETTEDTAPSTGAIVTGSAPFATTETNQNSTELHPESKSMSPSRNSSSSQYRERSPDHVPYLVGAGAGIFMLLMCIVVIVCVVRRRAPKRATEDFFMAGTLSGSQSGMRYDGSYHNAQVMTYSGLVPEVAESFNLEDIVLKSQSSSSEYETPRCLRET